MSVILTRGNVPISEIETTKKTITTTDVPANKNTKKSKTNDNNNNNNNNNPKSTTAANTPPSALEIDWEILDSDTNNSKQEKVVKTASLETTTSGQPEESIGIDWDISIDEEKPPAQTTTSLEEVRIDHSFYY